MKLNLGCGKDIMPGYVNIDRKPYPGVTVMDITKPLPFPDDSVDHILAHDVLEHILHWEDVVAECLRVLRFGGVLEVHVPHTPHCMTYHIRQFDEMSMDGFLIDSPDFTGRNATTLEGVPLARLVRMTVERRPIYPFAWHLKKYLGLPYIGRKWAIAFVLEKRGRELGKPPKGLVFDPLREVGP